MAAGRGGRSPQVRPGVPSGVPRSVAPWAVVDIDGVVADVRHRLHLVHRHPKQWDTFFTAADADPVLDEGAAVVGELAVGHEIVWLSGRPERCRDDTRRWLHAHGLPDGRLLLRREGDLRPARTVKLEALRQLSRERRVAVLVDDDAQVVAAAAADGYLVMHADWMGAPAPLTEAQERDGRT